MNDGRPQPPLVGTLRRTAQHTSVRAGGAGAVHLLLDAPRDALAPACRPEQIGLHDADPQVSLSLARVTCHACRRTGVFADAAARHARWWADHALPQWLHDGRDVAWALLSLSADVPPRHAPEWFIDEVLSLVAVTALVDARPDTWTADSAARLTRTVAAWRTRAAARR